MSTTHEDKFLTLSLNQDRYAIPVARVREVLEYERVTKLPRTATYMKGLIDVRGRGVPVMDLASRLGMGETAITRDAAIIVVDLELGSESAQQIGLLADAVDEVVEIESGRIEPAPTIGTGLEGKYLSGVARMDDHFVLILNMEAIFNEVEELLSVEA